MGVSLVMVLFEYRKINFQNLTDSYEERNVLHIPPVNRWLIRLIHNLYDRNHTIRWIFNCCNLNIINIKTVHFVIIVFWTIYKREIKMGIISTYEKKKGSPHMDFMGGERILGLIGRIQISVTHPPQWDGSCPKIPSGPYHSETAITSFLIGPSPLCFL